MFGSSVPEWLPYFLFVNIVENKWWTVFGLSFSIRVEMLIPVIKACMMCMPN